MSKSVVTTICCSIHTEPLFLYTEEGKLLGVWTRKGHSVPTKTPPLLKQQSKNKEP